MKRLAAAAFVAVSCFAAKGVDVYLTIENDTLLERQDNDYTHGTGLEVVDGRRRYKIGQNIYTPSDLRPAEHIKGDRPYAGFLYAGLGYDFSDGESPWTNYGELDFGVIGPGSMSEYSQKIMHKLLDCRQPNGWKNQLHNEFVVNAQWWTKYNWYMREYAALVPRAGVLAGTVQDAAELGCDLKVGWRMKNEAENRLMFSAGEGGGSWLDDLSAWVFAGAGCRYYLYNHILEGSLFSKKDRDLKVDIEPFVFEVRFGAAIRFRSFYVCYYAAVRTNEFKDQKHSPDYGGLCLGWSF